MRATKDCERRDAKRLLRDEAHLSDVKTVVRVYPDAVLYETHKHEAKTAWLRVNPLTGATEVLKVSGGFPAWPDG